MKVQTVAGIVGITFTPTISLSFQMRTNSHTKNSYVITIGGVNKKTNITHDFSHILLPLNAVKSRGYFVHKKYGKLGEEHDINNTPEAILKLLRDYTTKEHITSWAQKALQGNEYSEFWRDVLNTYSEGK